MQKRRCEKLLRKYMQKVLHLKPDFYFTVRGGFMHFKEFVRSDFFQAHQENANDFVYAELEQLHVMSEDGSQMYSLWTRNRNGLAPFVVDSLDITYDSGFKTIARQIFEYLEKEKEEESPSRCIVMWQCCLGSNSPENAVMKEFLTSDISPELMRIDIDMRDINDDVHMQEIEHGEREHEAR